MVKLPNKIKSIAVLILMFLALGCATKEAPKTDGGAFLPQIASPDDFPKEIARLEQAAGAYSGAPNAKIHLDLALLYINHKNPSPSYSRAIEEFENYIFLDPESGKSDPIQNWLSILRELKKIKEEKTALKGNIQQLTEENQRLKSTLEELKKLDRQLENKRRNK